MIQREVRRQLDDLSPPLAVPSSGPAATPICSHTAPGLPIPALTSAPAVSASGESSFSLSGPLLCCIGLSVCILISCAYVAPRVQGVRVSLVIIHAVILSAVIIVFEVQICWWDH